MLSIAPSRRLMLVVGSLGLLAACAAGATGSPSDDDGAATTNGGMGGAGGEGAGGEGGNFATSSTGGSGGTETCAAVTEEAELQVLPVDIIWVVDNSNSMQPAIAEVKQGLNDFAALIAASNLDYKVILLSERGTSDLSICIPPPLAGDANCGNGPRFFHSDVEIFSTQPLEQVLGTLGQTAGYTAGTQKGGEAWAAELRPEASKTILVVTDDNARLSATDFQTFPGGSNPFNSLTLPPGILDPSWGGLFDGYLFGGLYGWGNELDPSVKCTYPDASTPPSSGGTYSTLVSFTGGVRAKICDGASAWAPFFNAVAQSVVESAAVSCTLAIPPPPAGEELVLDKVNVALNSGDEQTLVPFVDGESSCGNGEGWYYDDPVAPTQVVLCPASCDQAQELAGPGTPGSVEVLFGCATILQ
jgi:hypothetical protein